MTSHSRIFGAIALLSGVAIASCSAVNDISVQETAPAAIDNTFLAPNVVFNVAKESGTCPDSIGLWELGWAFEGGADHTVVVDTLPITSQPAQIVQSEDRRIVYAAPLTADLASCVGTARSERLAMYTVQFSDGQLQFELDLATGDGFREIRYADISAGRPYVHWRAAE